ncbi:unnamed protein product [Fusarium langsethiae]|nr:unnamed protein product [Fusarium langsethiae]
MSDPEETQAYRDAKALITSTNDFIYEDKDYHLKTSIQWDDVIHCPVLKVSEPFGLLTALAGRIHDDCVAIASSGHVDDYQTRLRDLRSKAQALHEAFKTQGAIIEAIASDMKARKDLAFAQESNISIKLHAVDRSMEVLVKEANAQNASITELDKELWSISAELDNIREEIKKLDEETRDKQASKHLLPML